MFKNSSQFKFGQFSKVLPTLITFLLILATLFGSFNLLSFESKVVLAQDLIENLQEKNQETETITADINQVEQDTGSNYKFGQRIKAGIDKTQIKNDLCGQNIDFENPKLNSISAPKFDPNSASSVLKTLKTKCSNSISNQDSSQNTNSQISQSWLKLVWDNGLVGWVQIPEVQKVNQNSTSKTTSNLENLLKLGSIQALAQTNNGIKKTCSDFQFQVRDLTLLNQFPNLDLDDDGVGCEHLPINPNDQFIPDIAGFDTDKNGKITCSDFAQIIYDPIILARFSSLDTDKDGVGCESNKVNPNYKNGETFEPNSEDFVDIETLDFELTLDENTVDLGDLTKELTQTLNTDWQYLEANDQSCGNIICPIQSLSGLGRKGLWTFHFLTGILQGAGQSMVDLLGQIWNLVTKTGEVVSEIIKSVQALFGDSKLLLKLLQDPMLEMLKTDTMGRANLIGKAIGQFVPDVVLAVLTAGAANIAKSSLTALKTSGKLASTVIKFEKFVGRTIKILGGKYQFLLKKIGQSVGIAGREVKILIQAMTDSEFLEFTNKVGIPKKVILLQKWRNALKIFPKLDEHFAKHGKSVVKLLEKRQYGKIQYFEDAVMVQNTGIKVSEMNGYAKFIKNDSKGKALFGFVGNQGNTSNITTFHIKSITELQKSAPNTFPK